MVLRKACPYCGRENKDNDRIFYRDFGLCREITAFSRYDVFCCKRCGGAYAGNIEENMPLDEYYRKMSRYEGGNFRQVSNLWEQYLIDVKMVNEVVPENAYILDVGCAFGGLLNEFKKVGYQNLYGVEPSKSNCDYAVKEYGINVYEGNLGDDIPELHNIKFDLLILSGVLEHLVDVRKSVELCHSYLKENGKLLVIVPDAGMFVQHEDLYQEFSMEHINYFDIDSLSKLMKSVSVEGRHFRLVSSERNKKNRGMASLWERMPDNMIDLNFSESLSGENSDVSGYNVIGRYLESCKAFGGRLREKMASFNKENGYYIWGAGTNTAMLVQERIVNVNDIKGIFDSNRNYEGFMAYGQKIQQPEALRKLPPLPILIGSQEAYKAIKKSINEMGLKNNILNLYE